MDLRQLRHFQALYRLRSFARAADEMAMSQPALSRSIQNLERALDCRLFDRTTHTVTPTEAARRLIHQAETVIAAAAALKEDAAGLKASSQGTVRVGCGAYPLQPLLTETVTAFAQSHPLVHLTLSSGDTTPLLQCLLDRELDLVVCDRRRFDASRFADDILMLALPTEPLAVVFSAEHEIAAMQGQAIDFSAYPWALPRVPAGGEPDFAPASVAMRAGGAFPQFQLQSTAACLDLARSGTALTLVPLSLARRAAADGRLRYLTADRHLSTNDGVHLLKGRSQTPVMRAFVKELRSTARRLAQQPARDAGWPVTGGA